MIKTILLVPSRIACPSIPGTMKGIISSLKGVQDVTVRYNDRSVEVTFDDALITLETIIKKIGEEMGLAMREVTSSQN